MKACKKCKLDLPLTAFRPRKDSKDKLTYVCKACEAAWRKIYMQTDRAKELSRIKTRKFKQTERGAQYQIEFSKSDANKICQRKWRDSVKGTEEYRHKMRARKRVWYAKKTGKIKYEPCSVCGTTKNVHAHHHDYSKPLDVVFLCHKHHEMEHAS